MAIQKWNKSKPLKDEKSVNKLQQQYHFSLSTELEDCIFKNNGARPKPNTIKLKTGKENDIKILLSYNQDDVENIYAIIDFFMKKYEGRIIPFASDSSGNYYCEQNKKEIILWTQDEEIIPVCSDFNQFLDSIYELE